MTSDGAGADVVLSNTLRTFEAAYLARDEELVAVQVAVSRQERFTNVSRAGSMSFTLDEPTDFGGTGLSFDPAEALLAAVGASLSVTLTAHAAMRSLCLEGVDISLGAKIDGRSFFHPRVHSRAGLLETEIRVTLTSNEEPRALRDLFAEARRACPVLRSLKRSPKIALTLQKAGA